MAYCPKCNNPVSADARICPICAIPFISGGGSRKPSRKPSGPPVPSEHFSDKGLTPPSKASASESAEAGRRKTHVIDYVAYIVVTVIFGLIAAVVIPVYQDKKVQASVVEVIAFAKNATVRIDEYVRINGKLPDRPEEFDPGNVNKPLYLGEVRIESGGVIRLVLTGPNLFATSNLKGKAIVLTPVFDAGKVTWRCRSDINVGYLPAQCRKT